MKQFNLQAPLVENQIHGLNGVARNEGLIIVFENTKGLRISDLEKLDDSIVISITGGLTPEKRKYNNNYYQKRTYYSKKELIEIIKKFETIERKINPLWATEEKIMFVYQKLCEYLTYDVSELNGKDASRNLLGLITGKSVCAGCAMIFKEAMDRLGIKCHYQNMQSNHAWNIVEIKGKSHGIELTWDVYNKKNNTCSFQNFCRENYQEFYSDENHNLKNEPEEQEYPIVSIPNNKLQDMFDTVNEDRVIYIETEIKNGRERCVINNQDIIINNGVPISAKNILMTYVRNDGSSFMVIPTKKETNGVEEYIYLEYSKTLKQVRMTKIFSESQLVTNDYELRENIANNLLTKDRVASKIKYFNGYVGYVVKGSNIRYYNQQFEEEILNIYR